MKRKDKAYSDKWIFGWFFGNIKKEIKIKKWYQFRYCNFNYWWTRKGMRELYGVKTKTKNIHRRSIVVRNLRRLYGFTVSDLLLPIEFPKRFNYPHGIGYKQYLGRRLYIY